MKRFIYLCAMLLFVGLLSAAEIVVKEELRVISNDLTLFRNPIMDLNGRECALIKIFTDIAPFNKIASDQTPVDIIDRSGEVWLYLSPGERRLVFSKDGYARLNYDLPITIESNKVYEMKLIGSGVNVSRAFPVTIRVNPADAILKVDNVEYDAARPVLLEPGTYSMEVSKTGYITEQQQFTVSAYRVYFQVALKAQEPVLISIRSIPTEADIMINNVNEGKTNHQSYRFPGSYNLRITKTGYQSINEKISVEESGDNTFTYTLEKSTVTLSLILDPPDATVLINNAEVIGSSYELAPGQYKIEIKKNGYDTVDKRLELQSGKDVTESVTLKRQTGRLIFTVQPMEAKIILSDGNSWTGAKMLSLPAGEYKLSAKFSEYKNKEQDFTIESDQDSQIDIVMEKQSDPSSNMILIPAGSFTMGRTKGSGDSDELPTHKVTLSSFYMGKYEVTQAEWTKIMGNNPASGYGVGDNHPVYNVSWYAVLKYCNLRSMGEGLTPVYTISGSTDPANWGNVPTSDDKTWNAAICNWSANGYRLPTEAEWEYAARGATNKPDYLYSGSDDINAVAWYSDNNRPNGSKPVGRKAPNGLGLYDMSGNVWELCWDWYEKYRRNAQSNPTGPASGSFRVIRGGDWGYSIHFCRVAYRYQNSSSGSLYSIGFRLCRAVQ